MLRQLSLFIILAGAWLFPAATQAADKAALGEAAPAFTLTDNSGKPHSLADYKGKIVVLEWTNPQCPIVQRHYNAGAMQALQKSYTAKGVVWLAINSTHNTTAEENLKWTAQQKATIPILLDQSGATGKSYGARTTPHLYIVDAAGKLVYRGGIDDDPSGSSKSPKPYLANALDDLLAGKAVQLADTKPYGCSVKYAK